MWGQREGRPGHSWEGGSRGGRRRRGASGTSVPVTAVPCRTQPGAGAHLPPPAARFLFFRPSAAPTAAPAAAPGSGDGNGGDRWLRRAGGRTPTPPAPALRLPEAEGERGPAWATAAAPEEEGEERLAAARAAAARGEPAGAGECVQARGRHGRPLPPAPALPGPRRRCPAPAALTWPRSRPAPY